VPVGWQRWSADQEAAVYCEARSPLQVASARPTRDCQLSSGEVRAPSRGSGISSAGKRDEVSGSNLLKSSLTPQFSNGVEARHAFVNEPSLDGPNPSWRPQRLAVQKSKLVE